MADADSKYPTSDVIEELVRLRSEFLVIDALPENDRWSKRRKEVRKEGILYQFKLLLHDYLPYRNGTSISFVKKNYRWIPYYYLNFDAATMAGSTTTLGKIQEIWIDRIDEFLTLCKEGAAGEKIEEQNEQYNELKDEVEALIERFKSLIVSDVFL